MKTYKNIYTNDLITMTKTDKDGTKTEMITSDEYNNIVDSIPYFKRLGGHEIIRLEKYSKYGYNIVKYINSISPDGSQNIIYRFKV